jgi:hypothetical protein
MITLNATPRAAVDTRHPIPGNVVVHYFFTTTDNFPWCLAALEGLAKRCEGLHTLVELKMVRALPVLDNQPRGRQHHRG